MTHFPPFKFDPEDRTLWRGATEVPLTPKASALLACLLGARGAWVPRDAILSAVWPDTHVQPENVKVLVCEIRRALGDSIDSPAYIRSRARCGYAFVAATVDGDSSIGEGLLPARSAPYVTRARELGRLRAALAADSPPLVLVTGGHGDGKTSLCDAFVRDVRAAGTARVAYGQCFERDSAQEPYYPLLDAMLRLDRAHPGIVPRLLAEYAPSWLTFFPQWHGSRGDAVVARRTMLDELCAVLAAIARDLPLVIVIEDLQWADTATLDALAHVAESTEPDGVLVLASCSEGAWRGGRRARRRLLDGSRTGMVALQPFTPAQVLEYVGSRFGAGSFEALAPAVHAATGGNALLVAAVFDHLVERQLIVPGIAAWTRASTLDAIKRVLPDAAAGVITRQLETLGSREREAIEAASASAVGAAFVLADVAAALQCDPAEAEAVLAPLARREQLIVRSEDGRYCFRHARAADAIGRRAPHLRQMAFACRVEDRRLSARRAAT
jgi:DNA-binding winged helix-turn-helix (wHTH) protein